MIQLSEHGIQVVNNFNLVGSWIAAVVCCRNFSVCLHQYRRTRGKIHLVNLAQVAVFLIHRVLFGIVPLFELKTCIYFPLLVSLWHITYILFYIVMFMRLIILEMDRNSRWIKVVGVLLIALRAADWPYELAFHSITVRLMDQQLQTGSQCLAEWGTGVIILNFVGDALANLFLSGMFVRRLFIHINMSKSLMSHQNKIIERIAQKSLICLAFTFVVNLGMNLLKVTMFIGDHSDAFTVYFEIIESTLLVEALRNDGSRGGTHHTSFCESCQKEISHGGTERLPNNDEHLNSHMLIKSFHKGADSNSNKDRYNSTYTDDTAYNHEQDLAMHKVSSMEPALFFDAKSPTSFSHHSMRYSSNGGGAGGVGTSSIQLNRIPSPLTDTPLPSPPIGEGRPFSPSHNEAFVMTTQLQPPPVEKKSLASRVSSSITTATTDANDNSPDNSPYWRNN